MLPARGAVLPDVGVQLLALTQRVAGERVVHPAGEERLAQGEEFATRVVDVLDERGVQALQDVRVGAQREGAEALQFPAELFLGRPLDVRRRLLEVPEERGRREEHPRRSVSLPSVASPKAREPITQE